MPSCKDIYQTLNKSCSDILEASLASDKGALQSISHSFIGDMEQWISVLEDRPERPLLESSLREYQSGLLSVVQGQYRQAFMSLRLFLEQALAAVLFSANELELRLWIRGQQDIFWQAILDENNGVFSKRFVDVFNSELLDLAFSHREMARNVYRECSEFTHGNFHTHGRLPKSLQFSNEIFEYWHDKAETARLVVLYVLCVRYLCIIPARNSRERLEPIIMEHLGHIPAIRGFYDRSQEG